MAELLEVVTSWPSLGLVVIVFGFAPGFCLRLIVLTYPRSDPRRAELIAELYAVPRIQRPFWVAEQLEVALFEGLGHRVSAAIGRLADRRRARAQTDVRDVYYQLHAVVREQWRKAAPVPLLCSGRSDEIRALINQVQWLPRRRLVISGAPGSGKTTLAGLLVLQLLEDWQAGEPVPVWLPLAHWDPGIRPRFQDWLADQLDQVHPGLRTFGKGTAQKLAERGCLLLVLDGLDEIPPDRRRKVIDRFNASLHPDTGLIVTSRTVEYRDTVVLTPAAVIELDPRTPPTRPLGI